MAMIELQILILVIGILCSKSEGAVARKFVLQNEMSEHCRRRVVSSIFLGRQVSDSSAQVMHFSRLDLPYSCSISVRTESGSNIILVILSESVKSITSSCMGGHDQLLVYEMGETFGGYWGALPEFVFQQGKQNRSTYYTLRNTEALSTKKDIEVTDYDTLKFTEDIVSLTTPQEGIEDGYVLMEVPLVNVSGNIELGDSALTHDNENELFDLIYDVTPKNGVIYETSVMPLVQFSIWKQNGQNQVPEEKEPRYQLDYNVQGFTPDYRLTFPTNHLKRKFYNRPYYSTRRIKFKKKNKQLFAVDNLPSRIHSHPKYITELITTTVLNNNELTDSTTFKNGNDTWQLIQQYLKLVNVNNFTTSSEDLDDEALSLLKRISNRKHNDSVYLQPNLSKYSDIYSSIVEKKNIVTRKIINNYITGIPLNSTLALRTNYLRQSKQLTNNSTFVTKMPAANVKTGFSQGIIFNTTQNYSREVTTSLLPIVIKEKEEMDVQSTPVSYSQLEIIKGTITEKPESGTLVNHESWENIVQVAPEMADRLNVTTAYSLKTTTYIPKEVTLKNKKNRKKRYIQALSIENHGPRQLTTKRYASPRQLNNQFDSHHLAEVVELQDDEIQGRVALHYFENYVGPTFFNMCDYSEVKVKQVYLFNSSRIVIAISNFTMDRITIVMTESQVARVTGCPPAHLECQVSGVRVCVHNMNACDGLPNCGAYEIYDEDRLLCGSSIGFHYTVWLAACTFLVVLLTLLYTVHYWLKRCVPKVSQAFFLYTDKSENILYLDSIMRSPNDFDGGSRLVYHSSFYSDDNLSTESIKGEDRQVLNNIRKCFRFLFCKKLKIRSSEDKSQQDLPFSKYNELNRKFSFTEAELRKIGPITTRNASNQTGDSLEMAYLNEIKNINFDSSVKENKQQSKEPSISDKKNINSQQSLRELTTLRRIRSISSTLQSSSKNINVKNLEQNAKKNLEDVEEEVELRSTLYDRAGKRHELVRQVLDKTKYEIHSAPLDQKKTATKHLRFEERPTTIESAINVNDYEYNIDGQHRIIINTDRLANKDLDAIEEDEEVTNSGRNFKHFWGKGKKNKKTTHLSIR